MNLKVRQSQRYEGNHSWEWAVWIEGPDEDLDQIKEVVYKLHNSFRNPLRSTSDRASKFKLRTKGWGTFPIRVGVFLNDDKLVELTHELELSLPDEEASMERGGGR